MLWDIDRSSHQRNYFPNCTYGTGNFERCGCLSRHFTWLGVMRIPSVVAAWIRHVRACAPAGHVTVDIGLLKNAKFQGGFKKWMPFSPFPDTLWVRKEIKFGYSCSLCKILRLWYRQSSFLHSATPRARDGLSVSLVQDFAEKALVPKLDSYTHPAH